MANRSEYVMRGQQPVQKQRNQQEWNSVEMEDSSYQTEYARHMELDQKLKDSTRESKDSDSMQLVKQAMTQLTNALNAEIDRDVKKFKLQLFNIAQRYQMLIDACQNYQSGHRLNLSSTGRERSRMIAEIKERALEERMHFADVGSALKIHKHRVDGMIMGNVLGGMLTDYRSIQMDNIDLKKDCELMEEYGLYSMEQEIEETGEQFECYFLERKEALTSEIRNNIGMTRMMNFLGVGDLCQNAELALAKDEKGNRHFGMRVEKLRCRDDMLYDDLQNEVNQAKENGEDSSLEFSARAIRELSIVQMMRMLAGSADPNSKDGIRLSYTQKITAKGRVFCVTNVYLEAGKLDFTTLKPKQYEKKGSNGKTMKAADLPVIDTETAAAILAMRPEDFKFLTADLLSKGQQEAFAERLTWMQKQLTERIKADRQKPDDQRTTFRAQDWQDRRLRSRLAERCKQTGNLFPEMLNSETRFEDANNEENSPEEQLHIDLYSMAKERIQSAESPHEAVKAMALFFTALEYHGSQSETISPKGSDVCAEVQNRVISEMLTEDMLKAYEKGVIELQRTLVEAYNQKAQQNIEVPPEFYDMEEFNRLVRNRYAILEGAAEKKNEPVDEEALTKEATAWVHGQIKDEYITYLIQKENPQLAAEERLNASFINMMQAFKNKTGNPKMREPFMLTRGLQVFFGDRWPGGYEVFQKMSEKGKSIADTMMVFAKLNKDAVKEANDVVDNIITEQTRSMIGGIIPDAGQNA